MSFFWGNNFFWWNPASLKSLGQSVLQNQSKKNFCKFEFNPTLILLEFSFYIFIQKNVCYTLTHLHILHTKQKPIINRIKKIIVPIKTPIINGEFKQNSIQVPKIFHELTSSSSASPKVTLLDPKSFSFVICPLRSESECSGRVLTNVFKFWWSLVKISVKSKHISKSIMLY